MNIKGRRIACFLALPHHTRFFMPIRDEIRKKGGELLFITPLAEYPYELDMMKRKLSYRYFTDYMTGDIRDKINAGTLALFDEWSNICFRWEGFSRWPLFKQTWLLEELVEEYFCMENFIKTEQPDMFIAHHECARWGKIIGHLSLKNKIPFVTFQEGDYYASTLGNAMHTEFSTADLLWGNVTKRRLAGYRCSTDKMFAIGNTHIDGAIKEYNDAGLKAAIRKELNIPAGKKVILFLVSIKYGGIAKKEVWENLLQGLSGLNKDTVLIFKWHPGVHKKTIDSIREILNGLDPNIIFFDVYEPYRLIAISDYCVSLGQTTLTIEALAFGKPVFSVPDPDTSDDYYVNAGVARTVYPPGNWAALFDTIKKGTPPDVQANIDNFLAENFYKLDGRVVERATGFMDYIFEVRNKRGSKSNLKHREFTSGRVSFIIPSGHDSDALLATLTSLSQNVKYADWEVVLTVNNEAIKGMLSGISGDLKVVETDSSALPVLYNKGADASTGEYLFFVRPGIVYFKGDGLIDEVRQGIAGITLRNPDMSPYCLGIGFDYNGAPYRMQEAADGKFRTAGGGFIAMRREIYESLGGFDDEIANHLIEPDICLRAKDLNIPVGYPANGLAFNYRETFFGEDVSDENWKNRVKFFAKWIGVIPKDEDFLIFAKDIMKV